MVAPRTQPKWVNASDVLPGLDSLQRQPQCSKLSLYISSICTSLPSKFMHTGGTTATLLTCSCVAVSMYHITVVPGSQQCALQNGGAGQTNCIMVQHGQQGISTPGVMGYIEQKWDDVIQ